MHDCGQLRLEDVAAMVPKDDTAGGAPTSIGSLLHASGRCKPCTAFMPGRPENCRRGIRCHYCHFPHCAEQCLMGHGTMMSSR
jgi:hypothetical protein